MANSIEMTSIDDQILRIPLIEKDEIEEGSKVDHSININQILAEKFKDLGNSSIKSRTMFKVNVWLRESNPDAYTPKMVSIGPYHKNNVQLRPMEKYKWLYLRRFLRRKEGLDLESCIKELEGLKEKALKCYDDVETDEFCQMLLLDGCFVVELIRECWGMCPEGEDKITNDNIVGYIVRDLLLLENQLPFFILDKLHDMTKRDDELALGLRASIIRLPFFVEFPTMTFETFREITGGNIKHLLHLVHILSCPGNPIKKPIFDDHRYIVMPIATQLSDDDHVMPNATQLSDDDHVMPNATQLSNDDHVMPNATKLSEAGVKFDIRRDGNSIFDIRFIDGLMLIPQVRVAGDTESLLRNLIACEQQSVDIQPKHFSNFAIFMDSLIESDKDVTLLRQKRIIAMEMGADKHVANLFKKIASEVTVSLDFYCNEELRKAADYCENNRMRAVIVHYFLKNALRKASIVVAFIALIFTIIQTILAFTGSL